MLLGMGSGSFPFQSAIRWTPATFSIFATARLPLLASTGWPVRQFIQQSGIGLSYQAGLSYLPKLQEERAQTLC